MLNQDFKDLLSIFNEHGVEFLVVGAHALAAHGFIRATKDFDVWVRPNASNARRVMKALQVFGAPTHDVTENDFTVPGVTFQIGIEPVRIDVLTSIEGVDFKSAWQNRVAAEYGGAPAFVLSEADLIANKQASGRPQDLADIDALRNRKS